MHKKMYHGKYIDTFMQMKHSMNSSGRGWMDREDCGCRSRGKLIVYVISDVVKKVKITLMEQNRYRDIYVVDLKDGKGEFRAEGISMGVLTISSDIDGENTLYYPDHQILFEKNNYVHKVTLIDRRKTK